jgi:hypothetical protein
MKNLLKFSLITAGVLLSITLIDQTGKQKIEAATVVSGNLSPGQSLDTGNHTFDSSFQQNKDNWTVLAGNTSWYKWDTSGNNYFWLANSVKNSWVYHAMDATIDFSKSVVITTPFYYTNAMQWLYGDAAGFFLTPASTSQISSNAPNATGQYLGINGLKNSYFIGRDLYYNGGFDGPAGTNVGQNTAEIRKTDANGVLEKSSSSSIPWSQFSAPLALKGNSILGDLFSTSYTGSETLRLSWNFITDNGDGTYTGSLNLQSTPDAAYNNNGAYQNTGMTRTVTLPRNMTFGSLAITGSNTGVIQEGNATSAATFSATRGTKSITVKYLDATTNQPIKNISSSTITANTNDIVGVANGTATSTDDYTYAAPQISHYTFSKGESLKVLNDDETSTANNVINVYYTPDQETATFKTYYVSGTPGTGELTDPITGLVGGDPASTTNATVGVASTLPDVKTLNGNYNGAIGNAPSLTIPEGYELDHVVGPDGASDKTYPDLTSALAANPNYTDLSENTWSNYFSLYLKAKTASATFSYKYIEDTRPGTPNLPDSVSEEGPTGSLIEDPSESLPSIPNGTIIQSVTGPDGKNYSSLSVALAEKANKYYQASTVNFAFNVEAPPSSVLINQVPILDFGFQELKADGIYKMTPTDALRVTDDTYTNSGWDVSAQLTQQFTADDGSTLTGASLNFTTGSISAGEGNTADAPTTNADFTLNEGGGPKDVFQATQGAGQGEWNLSFSKVTLSTNGASLSVNKAYEATIEWSINDVPS